MYLAILNMFSEIRIRQILLNVCVINAELCHNVIIIVLMKYNGLLA